jgi:hypothetical protein
MPRGLEQRLCLLSVLLAGVLVQAQDGSIEHFVQAQRQNAAQLRQYSWTSRTVLKLEDEVNSVKLESVRYGANGQLQKTRIQAAPPAEGVKQKDEKKKEKNEKKKEEAKKLLDGLAKLAQSYANLTPAQTQAFAKGATISEATSDGVLPLQGSNVVVQGDHLTLRVDLSTFLIRQVNIETLYEKNPVTMIVSYGMLSQGLSYPSQEVLLYPKKEVQVIVQNSDYQPLQPSTALNTPVSSGGAPGDTTSAPTPDEGWPRTKVQDGGTLITYQPQVDEWKDFKTLDCRMAISLTPKGGKAVVGALSLEALTDVDNDTHLVLLHDLKIQHTNFPSLDPAAAAQMSELLNTFLPPTLTVTLERIVASTPKKESAPTAQLKNDPPHIFVSYKPAVLLDVDGEPVYVPVRNTNLEYAMNTSWRLIRDKTDSHYYFLAGDQWLTTANLNGPWSAATKLPQDMEVAAKDDHFTDIKNYVPLPPAKPGAIVPAVFYSTSPADVVLFEGHPAYKPIAGTELSYATNTVSYVFTDAKTKQVYYLTSGRWFSANSLDGPWTFATPTLPEDFSRIPESSPASQVLPSVPGTEEAKDSVLMAQIPTTAVIDPKAAAGAAKVTYDGDPKFAPIEGTSMQYATNTKEKVIKLGDKYYLCQQGVWFFGSTPQGSWQTAPSVPKEISEIPPNSPVYNVTYVTQTTLPSGEVEASYTAGYEGAFVIGASVGVVVAYGTGYYYPPYLGYYPGYIGYPLYYAAPYSYGVGAYYNSATGRYGVTQTAWGPYGSATRGASYNPYTGTATRSASVATPYGRASAGQAYNPYTGAYGATRQGSNAYSQWGSSVVSKNGQSAYTQHYSGARGTVGSVQGSQGGAAVGAVGRGGNSGFAGKTGSGDMYAGRDGNVYKNTGSGWQKYDNGNWNSVNKPSSQQASNQARAQAQSAGGAQRGSAQGSSSQTRALQSEAQSRQRGAQSSRQFQQRSYGGGGGAAMRGGGRRR